jgi:hypothetical protein
MMVQHTAFIMPRPAAIASGKRILIFAAGGEASAAGGVAN